jgi:5-methylcytosine-specific restriction endonuclease McrA
MATTSLITGIIQITRDIEKIYTNPSAGPKIIDSNARVTTIPSTKQSSYPIKQRECRICGLSGYTEWHHIISRGHAKKTNQPDLIDNPGNVVELCKSCHDQTTASKSRYLLGKKEKKWNKRFWQSHQ